MKRQFHRFFVKAAVSLGAGMLLLLLAWALARWWTEPRIVWQTTGAPERQAWFGAAGMFTHDAGTIRRYTRDRAPTSRSVIAPDQGYVADGAVLEGGDLALVFYRHDGGASAHPWLTRLDAELQPMFLAPLRGSRDRECGTGYVSRQLAGFADALWVTEIGERGLQLRRFDFAGHELAAIDVCAECFSDALWATHEHVVLLTHTATVAPENVSYRFELVWFSKAGALLSRTPLGEVPFGASAPAALAADGTMVAVAPQPLQLCDTHEPSLVRLGPNGCIAHRPLAEVVPNFWRAKPSVEPVVDGSPADTASAHAEIHWSLALDAEYAYLFTRAPTSAFERWFHRWPADADRLTIHRLDQATLTALDKRVLASGYSSQGGALWSDGVLLMQNDDTNGALGLHALSY